MELSDLNVLDLNMLDVVKLKKELMKRGLSVEGHKADLVHRLQKWINTKRESQQLVLPQNSEDHDSNHPNNILSPSNSTLDHSSTPKTMTRKRKSVALTNPKSSKRSKRNSISPKRRTLVKVAKVAKKRKLQYSSKTIQKKKRPSKTKMQTTIQAIQIGKKNKQILSLSLFFSTKNF